MDRCQQRDKRQDRQQGQDEAHPYLRFHIELEPDTACEEIFPAFEQCKRCKPKGKHHSITMQVFRKDGLVFVDIEVDRAECFPDKEGDLSPLQGADGCAALSDEEKDDAKTQHHVNGFDEESCKGLCLLFEERQASAWE